MRGRSSWIALGLAIAVIAAVLAATAPFWGGLADVQMSGAGWAAMILGVVLTLALGIGLMALVFISSRRGYDEGGRDER